jgi:RNA-directed DNA polymerase
MRRAKRLFDQIPERENLVLAVQKALRGKRSKGDARAFVARLDENLNALAEQLRSGRVRVGRATQFTIYDPKERLITAPCFAERVLHHAVMNVCEPAFEKRLIFHSYACRKGKGHFAALEAARRFAAGHAWFLKMDLRKYFDSIPKALLLERLGRVFAEKRLLDLFESILLAYRPGEACGLPIGSLISQHGANLYLDAVDRHVTERLGCGANVRYMDDFVVWGQDKERLKRVGRELGDVLETLGLQFKQEPYLNRTTHGMDFLGHRVFQRRVMLNRRSRARFVNRLRGVVDDLERGVTSEAQAQCRSTALCVFTRHFSSAGFRRRALVAFGCAPLAPTV